MFCNELQILHLSAAKISVLLLLAFLSSALAEPPVQVVDPCLFSGDPCSEQPPGEVAFDCSDRIFFSLAPGHYEEPQEVTITTPVPGGILRYTLDGRIPEESDPIPSGPIPVQDPLTTITARFWFPDGASPFLCLAAASFWVTTAPATFSPPSGPGTNDMQITILPGSENSAIYYAIGTATNLPAGITPGFGEELEYKGPFPIAAPPVTSRETAEIHLLARTSKPGLPDGFAQAVYSFPSVALPIFQPMPAATFEPEPRWVTISTSTPDAALYYTVDGSDPTEASSLYTLPVLVPPGTNLRVLAVKEGLVSSVSHIYYNSACAYYTALAATDPSYSQAAAGACGGPLEPLPIFDYDLSIYQESGTLVLSWPAVFWAKYQLQTSPDLLHWQNYNFPLRTAAGQNEISLTFQPTQTPTYFRVLAIRDQ